MPEERHSPKVFISYSRKDLDFVKQLAADLQAASLEVWYDLSGLEGGARWSKEIEKAIQSSQYVLVVLSPDSVASKWVEEEFLLASELGKKVVPLFYRSCEFPFGYRTLHFVDVRGSKYPQNYREILRALDIKPSDRETAEKSVLAKYEEVAAREMAEKEAAEKAALEKEEQEAAEKAVHEKARKVAYEKARLEAEERTRKEKAEKERKAVEFVEREKEKRDIAAKAKRERKERRATRVVALKETLFTFFVTLKSNLPKAKPFLRIAGFAGFAIVLFWIGSWGIPRLTSIAPSATSSVTITPTVTHIPPTKTFTLTPTSTHLPTWTPSFTPTVSLTPTPVPPNSILFQRDFENGAIGGWLGYRDGIWAIEQEPDGNHCLSGSGPATSKPQIWYANEQIRWTDYALETRVKFTKGHILYILVRSDVKSGEHYGVALNDVGFSLMRTWSMISKNISMVLAPNRWYTIRVEISGDSFSAYIDNDTSLEIELYSPVIQRGGFGYGIEGGENVCLDDIKAWSLK